MQFPPCQKTLLGHVTTTDQEGRRLTRASSEACKAKHLFRLPTHAASDITHSKESTILRMCELTDWSASRKSHPYFFFSWAPGLGWLWQHWDSKLQSYGDRVWTCHLGVPPKHILYPSSDNVMVWMLCKLVADCSPSSQVKPRSSNWNVIDHWSLFGIKQNPFLDV